LGDDGDAGLIPLLEFFRNRVAGGFCPGVYILENTHPPRGGISPMSFERNICKGEEKKGENVKEKGRKGKVNEKRGSKRVK
jgi:hypothetical protein